MGTSLTVYPFAQLTTLVDDKCPRVLINLERVGNFSSREDDVLLLGKCDEKVRELCQELGWEKELDELWKETEGSLEVDEEVFDGRKETLVRNEPETGKEESDERLSGLGSEVDKLAEAIDRTLTFFGKEQDLTGREKEQNEVSAVEISRSDEVRINLAKNAHRD